jgi:hypothetical protein
MAGSSFRITDGSMDFSGGVDSGRVSTVEGPGNPNGLSRNQLAWLTNGTVRGGGISPRFGWKKLVEGAPWSGLFQGASMYEPIGGNPYIVLSIGGVIYRVRVDTDNSIDNISIVGDPNPPLVDQAFMVQGEQFLVVQAGDLTTLPLFWDGTTMRRSLGLNQPLASRELPSAGPMDYFMGRIWYAVGRTYTAGDIVGGPAGTAPYRLRDSILHATENPLALAGDGFIVPTNAGNIRALKHSANLNTALGQSSLYIFTRESIYSTEPPVKRADWITLTEPLQRVVQDRFGSYSDRGIVSVNGDLFYQSPDGIRSLFVSVRNFQQWGNTDISNEVGRVINFNDRALMRFASGINFSNRLLECVLPVATPVGVACQGIVPLDFDLISSLAEKLPPAWEGLWEGVKILQLLEADFGGLQRAFAVVYSEESGEIEIWELTDGELFEDGDKRLQWQFDTPSYTFNNPFQWKELVGGELWVDRLRGTVVFHVEYKPDESSCFVPWISWTECSAQNCGEDVQELFCPPYPTQEYCPTFRATMDLPYPPVKCDPGSSRPTNMGYKFQVRVRIRGSCRVRGLLLHAVDREKANYENLVC